MHQPFPILSCTNPVQLSDFVTQMVPKIWTGTPFLTSDRSITFNLFCQNILKTTQISSSCILIALFYIYRLRFAYPTIQGSTGSEVRLFTTALILANKFLDDNTFTNKSWSQVSGVPVHELNIMEMEFLSALQYRTYVHHLQFYSWIKQCNQWLHPIVQKPLRKKKRVHPWHYYYYPAASSVATAAAATAMNFI
ncbi:hypothetical protein G6F26_005197 [Rhizopus arrhizus]|nr:hypothetical protein G6F23_006315 [Rhizopus arrhizus]KAG1414715.1 hypothetical protein G6F58_006824 [Rhizopus delemar]KAG0852988.1 hypothetical protein G6F17_007612 [Rhizopus arrhizus]KAG0873542.1 hypothetical protein G6F16_004402 [Rhizopus arrhizus]KAG0898016.1 hypothetical protein G6F34_005967 [Rhizopus arrhizus]